MSNYSKIFFLLFSILFINNLHAQQYLELVENKGQWDERIAFKGEMVNGSFAIMKGGGYRMMLHNTDDMEAISAYYHGHSQHPTSTAIARTSEAGKALIGTDIYPGLRSHVYEIKFLNSNATPTLSPEKPQETYNNYIIGKDAKKWASSCKIYTAVTVKNIYPGIDIRYYTDKGNLKYDFIIQPGVDYTKIAFLIDGADGVKVKNNQLVINTSVGAVQEAAPFCFQPTNAGRTQVNAAFVVKGNIVQFGLDGKILPNAPLIIDPQLVFSTFTGSAASNWGFTATYDGLGNFYAGGIVFGAGFPTTNGAFQTNFGGGSNATGESSGFDIGIMKFNPTGTARIYATYIGGSGNEYPHSLVVDSEGELIIAGRASSQDYPTTRPNYGECGGTFDIILSKLNARGSALVGSVRVGGKANDGVNIANKYPVTAANSLVSLRRNYGDDSRSEVIIDDAGNIYLSSSTQSDDFPVTANAVQPKSGGANAGGRAQDGVLMKWTPDLSTPLYSSYLGGKEDDAAFVLAINPIDKNIYVAGATASRDFPGNKSGVLYSTYQGSDADGFVAVFSNDGSQLIRTAYLGTSGVDIIYGIQFDKFGFPYIMGTTTGTWPITSNVVFKQNGGKQFISKLKPDLSNWEYSTVFGTNASVPNISPTAFLVDRCENVYVSGWGGKANSSTGYPSSGTLGLTATPDAIKSNTDGSDFYFFVLEKNAQSQLYGSFFGQDDNIAKYPDHVDGGTSRFDRNGVIYQSVCANCEGPNGVFYTSPGVVAPLNGALSASSGGCNLAAIKIAFNLAGVGASLQSKIRGIPRVTSGCLPLVVDFKDTIANAKKYIWDFGDGSAKETTTVSVNQHTYTAIGSYKVMLVAIDSQSCNIADTSYLTIRSRDDAATLGFNFQKVGGCESTTYQFNNTSQSSPGKPFKNNSFILYFGDGQFQSIGTGSVTHTYASTGTFDVKLVLVDTNYCNYPDSVVKQIRLAPNVKAQITTPPSGCAPYNAIFTNSSIGGITFNWDFGDGTTYTGTNPPPHLYPNIGTYTIKLEAFDNASCNKTDATTITITVYDKPVALFSYSPKVPTENTPVEFTNLSIDGVRYKWTFGDGDSLITTQKDTLIRHYYNATKTYNACLTTYNAAGCDSTVCQQVSAIVVPILDVANAFAPDGTNKIIKVQGFGINQMIWRIYNRWGEVVFQSNNKNQGWDGTYNGKPQPMDVYSYVLDVTFTDGSKFTKKGDITLIR